MSNDITAKHGYMYAGNAKLGVVSNKAAVTGAAKTYTGRSVFQKITITAVGFWCGNTAGTFSTAMGTLGLYKGTQAAIAAAKASSNTTGLTAVASRTMVAGDVVATTFTSWTLSTTAADLNVDGTLNAPVGLCLYCDVQGSNTFPIGDCEYVYVIRDEEQ